MERGIKHRRGGTLSRFGISLIAAAVCLIITATYITPPIAGVSPPPMRNVQSPPPVEEVELTESPDRAGIPTFKSKDRGLPTAVKPADRTRLECLANPPKGFDVKSMPTSIAGNRPVGTYLCEYFPKAKTTPLGCQIQCGDVRCDIQKKASVAGLHTADVIVNHFGPVPDKKNGKPIFTVWYQGESNASEVKKSRPQYQALYDIIVGFHKFRPFRFTWTNRYEKEFGDIASGVTKFADDWSNRLDAVAVFVGKARCGKGRPPRDTIIRELGKRFKVHSFGKCANTDSLEKLHPECAKLQGRYPQKLCVFKKYKFVLTLENSVEEDYVTEKVYHGLLAGAIPIYEGAPNVGDYVPSTDGLVLLRDFLKSTSPAVVDWDQLLVKMKEAVANPAPFFAWHNPGSLQEWPAPFLVNLQQSEPTCAICQEVAERKCMNIRDKGK